MKYDLGVPFNININDIFKCDLYTKSQIYILLSICFILIIMTLFLMGYNFPMISDRVCDILGTAHINHAMSFLFGAYIYAFISKLSWFRINSITLSDVLVQHITSLFSMLILFCCIHFLM